MKITIPKNAKAFVSAIKTMAALVKHAEMVCSMKDGLVMETMTEDRTGYMILTIKPKDVTFDNIDDPSQEVVRVGVDLKQLSGALRCITTLSDAVVLEIDPHGERLVVVAKTKKEELTTELRFIAVCAELLEVPRDKIQCVCVKEMACKDLEGFIKGSETDKVTLSPSELGAVAATEAPVQRFLRDSLLHMVRPTLFKTVHVQVNAAYPICFTYKVYKDSSLVMYLAESK
jgi:hypothetical protein